MSYLRRVITVSATLTTFTVLLPLVTLAFLRSFNVVLDQEIGVSLLVFDTIPLIMLVGNTTYLLTGFVISGLSLSAYLWLNPRLRRMEKIKNQLGDLVSVFMSHVMAGVSIIDSLKKTAEFVGPPTSEYLETYAYLVSMGEDPLKAEAIIARELPKEIRLVFTSISQAMKSGGRYLEVLSQSEKYLRQLIKLTELRKSRLSEYKLVLILSVIAYTFSAIVTLKLVTSLGANIRGLPIPASQVSINTLKSAYYVSSLILTGITSIIMSKTIEGYAVKSLKYISILVLVVTAMFVGSELI